MPASEALRAPTMATGGSAKTRGVALDREQRRRMVHAPQQRRIVGFADADEAARRASRPPRARLRPRRPSGCAASALAPPASTSSGSISSAASAEPKRLIRSRKVAGPTFRVRIRRSQLSRCRSLRRGAGGRARRSSLRPDPRFGAGQQPRDVGAVLVRRRSTLITREQRRRSPAWPMKIERNRHDDARRPARRARSSG